MGNVICNAEMMERKKQIIASQPHLTTIQSGNTADSTTIAHFKTDIAAPVKSLKVNFLPIQEGSGTPSPSNVRAISGNSSIAVTRCGKNLLSNNWTVGQTYRFQRIFPDDGETKCYMTYEPKLSSSSLNIGFVKEMSEGKSAEANKGYNWIGYQASSQNKDVYTNTVQSPNTQYAVGTRCAYVFIYPKSDDALQTLLTDHNVQVELGETPTAIEAYTGTTQTVDWSSIAGTVYGGYVDLVTGELVVTHGLVVLDGTETWGTVYTMSDRFRFSTPMTIRYNMTYGDGNTSGVVMADWAYAGANGTSANTGVSLPIITAGSYNPQFYIAIAKEMNISTIDGLKAYLSDNPLHVIIHHATPITYQLTPQTIRTLRGINNIWSDAGDVSVTYWTH